MCFTLAKNSRSTTDKKIGKTAIQRHLTKHLEVEIFGKVMIVKKEKNFNLAIRNQPFRPITQEVILLPIEEGAPPLARNSPNSEKEDRSLWKSGLWGQLTKIIVLIRTGPWAEMKRTNQSILNFLLKLLL